MAAVRLSEALGRKCVCWGGCNAAQDSQNGRLKGLQADRKARLHATPTVHELAVKYPMNKSELQPVLRSTSENVFWYS